MNKALFLSILALLLITFPAIAQEDDPALDLQKELWCPICQGIRLDVCEQKVCEQMRDLIDNELAAGKTPEQIKADFIDYYGPVVLGEPPREGFNLIAWIVPIVLVVGGLAGALLLTRRWTRKPEAAVVTSETANPEIGDDYLARVEKELSEQ